MSDDNCRALDIASILGRAAATLQERFGSSNFSPARQYFAACVQNQESCIFNDIAGRTELLRSTAIWVTLGFPRIPEICLVGELVAS
jgi:hypothetical protein